MKQVYVIAIVVVVVLLVLGVFTYFMCTTYHPKKKQDNIVDIMVPIPMKVSFPNIDLSLPLNKRHSLAVVTVNPQQVQAYCDKYQLDYLEATTNHWLYLFQLLKTNQYDHVVVLLDNVTLNPDSNKPVQRLIRQSGDSDLIVCRDATDPSRVSTRMLLFKNSEWSQYKCMQLCLSTDPKQIQSLLLNQVYTPFQQKTLLEAKKQLDIGLPYMLQCICVYNEKAFELDHALQTMYPWTGIQGYVELQGAPLHFNKQLSLGQRIPKRIYQTMNTTLTNQDRYKFSVQAWKQLNPEYEYYFFDATGRRELLKTYFDANVCAAYDMLLPGAYQADLFRYCLLYVHGGCYVDSQTQPFISLREVIAPDTEMVSALDVKPYGIWNGFLCTAPEHPAIKLAIDQTVKNILDQKNFKSPLRLTGPLLLGMSVNKWLKRHPKQSVRQGMPATVKLLKSDYSHPGRYKQNNQYYLYLGKNKFMLNKYIYNTQQLTTPSTGTIYEITGTEYYQDAHAKKRVFKKRLLETK